jgi:Na+-translocating ferredoxin:NAD+ oxidoreductase subunit A
MKNYLLLVVSTALVNNIVLVKVLGLCPVLGVSKKLETSIAVGIVTSFVLTLVSGASYLINQYLLVPFEAEYLRIVAYMLAIAACASFAAWYIGKANPVLHRSLGVYLPLAAANCAVLGGPLLFLQDKHNFIESLFFGLGNGIGFTLVLVIFASLRERLDGADIPRAFRGSAIALVTAGLMSLAFMGFAGLVK